MSNQSSNGVLENVTRHLGGIFRHTLPGLLVVGAAVVAFPDRFDGIRVDSWQHLVIAAAATLAIGNTWFALNRYGLHQAIDWVLWRLGFQSPAKTDASTGYLDDLGKYANRSLRLDDSGVRAQDHVSFRASIVLLILTLGELMMLVAAYHSASSLVASWGCMTALGGAVIFGVGVWQMAITRRIDHYVVNHQS